MFGEFNIPVKNSQDLAPGRAEARRILIKLAETNSNDLNSKDQNNNLMSISSHEITTGHECFTLSVFDIGSF
jgi:hypothetical protein